MEHSTLAISVDCRPDTKTMTPPPPEHRAIPVMAREFPGVVHRIDIATIPLEGQAAQQFFQALFNTRYPPSGAETRGLYALPFTAISRDKYLVDRSSMKVSPGAFIFLLFPETSTKTQLLHFWDAMTDSKEATIVFGWKGNPPGQMGWTVKVQNGENKLLVPVESGRPRRDVSAVVIQLAYSGYVSGCPIGGRPKTVTLTRANNRVFYHLAQTS